MLSDDETTTCEECNGPAPKNFEYYASKAEAAIAESGKGDPNSHYTAWQMNVAELYVRLAASVPKQSMIYRRADGQRIN